MSKLSELSTLIHEYRKLNRISSLILNEEIAHDHMFQLWISNIVIDTVNYEKMLLQILEDKFKINYDVNQIAEIGSKPLLSSAEKLSTNLVTTYNYNNFLNDFKVNPSYQKDYFCLSKDIECIDLLLAQSNQYESVNKQRDKLVFIHRMFDNVDVPFVIGCYGDSSSKEFKEKSDVLSDFSRVTNATVKVYNETYNGLDCQFLIVDDTKEKVKLKVKSMY